MVNTEMILNKSLKGLNLNSPGCQPRENKTNNKFRPRRKQIEKQLLLLTQRKAPF
jgi:hypothetical protein